MQKNAGEYFLSTENWKKINYLLKQWIIIIIIIYSFYKKKCIWITCSDELFKLRKYMY